MDRIVKSGRYLRLILYEEIRFPSLPHDFKLMLMLMLMLMLTSFKWLLSSAVAFLWP